MQLIIAGASGYLATEVVRQALSLPKITSVIALARRPISAPENLGSGADVSKLKSVVVKDYDEYPGDVKKLFTKADACIWYPPPLPTTIINLGEMGAHGKIGQLPSHLQNQRAWISQA
jgi:hypothetical protein